MSTFASLDKVSTTTSWEDTLYELTSIGLVFSVDKRFNRLEVRNPRGELLCVLWEDGMRKLVTALSQALEDMTKERVEIRK